MKNLSSLLYLLQDDDPEVRDNITNELIKRGENILPELERICWEEDNAPLLQERLEEVIYHIHFQKTEQQFDQLLLEEQPNLLHFLQIVARIESPDMDVQWVNNRINNLVRDIDHNLSLRHAPLEKVRRFNEVFFETYSLRAVREDDPVLFQINHGLASGKCFPDLLSLIYLIASQRLQLPIYGIAVPGFIILGLIRQTRILSHYPIPSNPEIIGYINPEDNGEVFDKSAIDYYLNQVDIPPQPHHFLPAEPRQLMRQFLYMLEEAYVKSNAPIKALDVRRLQNKI